MSSLVKSPNRVGKGFSLCLGHYSTNVDLQLFITLGDQPPDAGDDLVIDCVMNASATVITSNLRDFQSAKESLGLQVMTPAQLIIKLASIGTEQ
jgi:hypothetical protein